MEEETPGIQVTEGLLTAAPGYHERIQCASVLVSPPKEITKGSLTTPSTGIVTKQHSCLEIVCLTRIFSSKLMSSESFLAKVFLGFPRTKDINDNTHLESTHCIGAVTTHRIRPTTILNCSVSLTFPLHSTIGNLTLSLNVFLFLLFSFQSLQNALCDHGHENARTNMKKRKSILFHLLRCHLSLAVHF